MEYIDKHIQQQINRFNSLIDSFIAQGKVHYKELDETEKDQIRDLLRIEQNGFCAYCMQQESYGTVDHVIPQYIEYQDFRKAFHKGKYVGGITYQGNFNAKIQPRQYYPHTLAYGNLVYACSCCNRCKDRDVIYPNFFDNPTNIEYQDNGKAKFPSQALSLSLASLLNENTYCRYRAFWKAVKSQGLTMPQVKGINKTLDRKKFLESLSSHVKGAFSLELKKNAIMYSSKKYWEIFMSFQWFYGYY